MKAAVRASEEEMMSVKETNQKRIEVLMDVNIGATKGCLERRRRSQPQRRWRR
jgi:hypothetical protein